uniref:Uncharacterized protein n=1 Tax=Anguilla anguilla TaxID=7936 RepID=A0A0E9PEM3_ANGAN
MWSRVPGLCAFPNDGMQCMILILKDTMKGYCR